MSNIDNTLKNVNVKFPTYLIKFMDEVVLQVKDECLFSVTMSRSKFIRDLVLREYKKSRGIVNKKENQETTVKSEGQYDWLKDLIQIPGES